MLLSHSATHELQLLGCRLGSCLRSSFRLSVRISFRILFRFSFRVLFRLPAPAAAWRIASTFTASCFAPPVCPGADSGTGSAPLLSPSVAGTARRPAEPPLSPGAQRDSGAVGAKGELRESGCWKTRSHCVMAVQIQISPGPLWVVHREVIMICSVSVLRLFTQFASTSIDGCLAGLRAQ